VPLLLKGEGKEKLVLWEPKQRLAEMKLAVDFEVDTLIFDPYVKLLAKASVGGMNLNQVQENAFDLYPNPTSGVFVLYARNPSAVQMEVFDAVGQKVKEVDTKGNVTKQLTVSLGELSVGPYFLRINDGNFIYSYKLIKN
jgi:hypothetical protein